MPNRNSFSIRALALSLVAVMALFSAACAKPATPTVKKVPANQENTGFLKDYSKLAPNPNFEASVKTFVNKDAAKNLHKYIAVVVDPVEVYLAADADDTKIPEKTRAAIANYFRAALTHAVADAFPPVDEPGPLVLRLRAAVIGIESGDAVAAADKPSDPNEAIDNTARIGKVGVELELVDSVTGEQIAAMVDRESLGAGAEVAATSISRHEKSQAARHAFDEWASRVRLFLDRAHELNAEDAKRADEAYRPFGEAPATK